MDRRSFIKSAAATVTIIPSHVLGGPKHVPPSEKLNVAIVGCGGLGMAHVNQMIGDKYAQVVAVADPHDHFRWNRGMFGSLEAKKKVEKDHQKNGLDLKCNTYRDFRVMFDKEKNIDAVICATPDHNHALVAMAAIKRGKHIYCQKPLTRNIWESRQLVEAAENSKVVTQMGNQGHSFEGNPLMREWLADGAIGKVLEVHAWTTGRHQIRHTGWPVETPPVPENMDWDIWLGPRPKRPYSPEFHPFNWRSWWDFGTTTVGDMCIHHFDSSFTFLDPGHPTWIEGQGSLRNDPVVPANNKVTWMYEKTDKRDAVKFVWYDGKQDLPRPEELEPGRKMGGNGVLVIGEKGKILGDGWSRSVRIIPEAKMREYKRPPKTLPRYKSHHGNWVNACRGLEEASSPFSLAAKLNEFALLGALSLRAEDRIYWNGESLKVKGMPELDQYIHEEYHNGWSLENI